MEELHKALTMALELIKLHNIDAPNTIGFIQAVLERTQPKVD